MSSLMQPPRGKIKKVLMIARVFPPFQSVGHSIRVLKFIKYLPAYGWLPSILTIDDQKEYEFDRKQGSETMLLEIETQVKIYRTNAGEPSLKYLEKEREFGQRNWLTRIIVKVLGGARRWAFRNIFLPDRCLVWLPFALRRGRQIVSNERIDVIFVTCPPHSATLIGIFLKLLTGKPLILDFRDDWIDTPWYRSRATIRRWIECKMENWAVKTADKIILVTEWSKNAFLGRYPSQPTEKFIFLSNGCDLADFSVLNSMIAAPRNSMFTIVHAGSVIFSKFWGRSPAGLFQAVHQIIEKQSELTNKLTLVFAGDLPEEYRRLAEEIGISSVIKLLGHVPHDEVLRLIKSADLLLAMNYEGWSTLIPGKIYEYWAVGGPPILLLSCPGAASDFVERYDLGFTVEPFNAAGIQQAILTVYRKSKTDTPLRVKTAGIDAHDRQVLTRQLAQVLTMVI